MFILRYRLRSEGHFWPAQQEDCREAMAEIRKRAAQCESHTDRVGVIGFSAGGHLASVAATMFDKDVQPNFQMLIYAATNVETPSWNPWKARFGYPGREANTFDKVTPKTPPLFAAVSKQDEVTTYAENTCSSIRGAM